MQLLAHPLYLAPLPLYIHLYAADTLLVDGDTPFVKQTFRNRAIIATENGTQTLTIPIVHQGRQAMRDVRISEHGNWRHLHWNALVSAYRKSPFFEYYADDFERFYRQKDGFLMDFNLQLHALISELLGLERTVQIAKRTDAGPIMDMRAIAEPNMLPNVCSNVAEPYYQVFAARNGFIPNLSIVDLLFNMGPEGLIVLRDASKNINSTK